MIRALQFPPLSQSKAKGRRKAGLLLCLLRGRELHPHLEVMSLANYYYSTPLCLYCTLKR